MADTNVSTGLTVEQWDDKFFTEYLTENRFSGEFGTDESSIIQVKEDLTKKKGDRINFALVNKLTNDAITGSNTLEGNEERMDSRSFEVAVDKRRNGVRVAEIDEQYSAIDLRQAAKATLKEWSMKDTEKLVIEALASINGTNYSSASEASKDAWLVDNSDRVLFGAAAAGYTDHSSDLSLLDTSADSLTASALSKLKYMARVTANPKIRPIRSEENGRHYYIAYVDPRLFRDLKNESSSPIRQAQREVSLEMENNRLFKGGDLLWDGIIIHEVDDIEVLTGVGNGGIDVEPMWLCGAQALVYGIGKRWKSRTKESDYGDKFGVAMEEICGIHKSRYGSGADDTSDLVDHGVVTGYYAGVADV